MNKAGILVVEDEAIIAMEIESSLQNLGYDVTLINFSRNQVIQNG